MLPVMVEAGGRRRRMAREVADFPEPDSPTRPRVSPSWIWKEMLSTAGEWWKAMERWSTWRSGWGIDVMLACTFPFLTLSVQAIPSKYFRSGILLGSRLE